MKEVPVIFLVRQETLQFSYEWKKVQVYVWRNVWTCADSKARLKIYLFFIEDHDGAEPCGNSVSVSNLLRLGAYLDKAEYKDRAGKLLAAFTSRFKKMPVILPEMVSALLLYHDGPTQVKESFLLLIKP